MTIFFDMRDKVLPLLHRILNQGVKLMATQQQAVEAISTLHTALTDAVGRINAFQQGQSDNINQLKQQVADLQVKVDAGDFPDDVVNDVAAMRQTVDAIDVTPITPPDQPPPDVTPPAPPAV